MTSDIKAAPQAQDAAYCRNSAGDYVGVVVATREQRELLGLEKIDQPPRDILASKVEMEAEVDTLVDEVLRARRVIGRSAGDWLMSSIIVDAAKAFEADTARFSEMQLISTLAAAEGVPPYVFANKIMAQHDQRIDAVAVAGAILLRARARLEVATDENGQLAALDEARVAAAAEFGVQAAGGPPEAAGRSRRDSGANR